MPFSHHSHSGQFCPGHASNTLAECIETAIARRLRVFGLTEHMPRHEIDFYPEERESDPAVTEESHSQNERDFFEEACRLREKYQDQIALPIGFECDWIRLESKDLILRSINSYDYDFFLGSLHHVHTIPIDYDQGMYDAAREKAGGTDEALFEDYFDAQHDMLRAVKPPVVGHFDLIRLKSNDPDVKNGWSSKAGVWERIIRNLNFIASYDGILEVNTAALRKGMAEPYPKKDIIQAALERSIRLCLSDDSHGVAHIAYGYPRALDFLKNCGVKKLCYLTHKENIRSVVDKRFPHLEVCESDLEEVQKGFHAQD